MIGKILPQNIVSDFHTTLTYDTHDDTVTCNSSDKIRLRLCAYLQIPSEVEELSETPIIRSLAAPLSLSKDTPRRDKNGHSSPRNMLKPLNQPRLSSVSSSPRLQQQTRYVSSSPRTTTAPRRKSNISTPSLTPSPAPPRQAVQYVSRGTQYSPMIEKMDGIRPEPILVKNENPPPAEPTKPTVIAPSDPPSPTKPELKPESPGVKRRKPADEAQSNAANNQELAAKRTRPAPEAVKVLPAKYEECAVEDLVVLIASMVSELIETNDALPPRPNPVLTRFHSRTPPGISVVDYLQRLAKHATLTPPLLLSMVYYIDRLCALYPDFTVTTLTIHRFLITAATVAAKGLSDSFWNNSTYARVGGIKIAELGLLELDFLYRVDWKIVPNPEVLVDYYKGLIERTEGFELEGGDSSSDDELDEEDEEADSEMADSPPDGEVETERAAKWQAWMDENSIKNAGAGEQPKQSTDTGESLTHGAEAGLSTQGRVKQEVEQGVKQET